MSEIATLLEDDAAYAREARRLMDELDPGMYAAFGEAARLYEFLSNVFANSVGARIYEYAIRSACTTCGIPWKECVHRVADGDDHPAIVDARERGLCVESDPRTKHHLSCCFGDTVDGQRRTFAA